MILKFSGERALDVIEEVLNCYFVLSENNKENRFSFHPLNTIEKVVKHHDAYGMMESRMPSL